MPSRTDILLEQNAKSNLIDRFSANVNLSPEEIQKVNANIQFQKIKKNQLISSGVNEPETYYYFIYSGVVKIYYYKNDQMIVERFEKENGVFGGNFTNLFNHDEYYNYEAVENVVLIKLKYTDLISLCKQYHAIESLYRVMLESFISVYLKRLTTVKSLTAEERYSQFIEINGDLMNRVNLKDVANYLDMTPETLSRIRSKYDKYIRKQIVSTL
ncbi:MAG TPA: Crp/Fnr family transcriptional regulator [Chitinophagales bacterium]|mgnify:CR=1 FL=1|jgi:CRP-like cAMP-binding protein|nr:Crp/Fnr family transcriptional regulator [Chitinophagales bacterium]MBP6155246.1 Crp/Fnr family transcriptional regulator [Chitinophagales bacterium]HQV77327.1 Crp/Fnr family transcriptional regulator [Chitinophagales bacterium]HQW78388.1 Crp/Fnr family transcriptional regulator [Chitinophagales bacterium]HRB19525.1 Crp/Fnr family transcriptional regulator [Chitinophagales bacterium]